MMLSFSNSPLNCASIWQPATLPHLVTFEYWTIPAAICLNYMPSGIRGMLMHKNPLGRDNRARERGPHRSQEQVDILKELATLIAARTTRGRPGWASVVVQQCMIQFGLYSDFKMTPQEVNRVVNLPEWRTVLEELAVMIKPRREDLAFRTTKQKRWNQRAKDQQAHKDFLEEHRGTGKFSGKYAP